MKEYNWTITLETATRIDKFIHDHTEEWSRTQIQTWIKEGRITVNGEKIKSNYKLNEQDFIQMLVPEETEIKIEPENIPLNILYEDDDLIVINKQRGMVVHPAPGHYSNTLVNGLLYHCPEMLQMSEEMRPGIVHRLDKDTTGAIIVAKNERTAEALMKQLKNREVERIYEAIVHGIVAHQHGTIDAPIGRDKKDRQSMTVTEENSRDAVTHFTVLECFNEHTFVQCELETGRTHQIRVHMKYIDHPIAADPKYGPKKKSLNLSGQALHAASVRFVHPSTNEEMFIEAPLPDDMKNQLQKLRNLNEL